MSVTAKIDYEINRIQEGTTFKYQQLDLPGELQVRLAGVEVARGVVVGEDNALRCRPSGRPRI